MNDSVGVVIGRFQVDEIHDGHLQLLATVTEKHSGVVILLGSARTVASRDNPLNYAIRHSMLEELFPSALIMPVFDCQTDEQWSYQVDSLIQNAYPHQPAVLYGGRKSFIPHYVGRHVTRELDFGTDNPSGSDRRKLISQVTRHTPDFRAGVIHALNNLPPQAVPCVDIIVYRPLIQEWELLLGRKDNERGWRVPGGHVDVTDPNYTFSARREIREETGVVCESDPIAIGSFAIDDWRTRERKDLKYFTTLFVHRHNWGIPKAGDDLAEVGWFTILEAHKHIMQDHVPLIKATDRYLTTIRGEHVTNPA